MKSAGEIASYIATRIDYVYDRPLMYGFSGEGVDQLLLTYHEIWAEIKDRQQDFDEIRHQVLREEECGSANFSTRYKMNNPAAADREVAEYAVKQWRKISVRMGLYIPHID